MDFHMKKVTKYFLIIGLLLMAFSLLFTETTVMAVPTTQSLMSDSGSSGNGSDGSNSGSTPSNINNSSCRYFLGMVSWDCNVDIEHKNQSGQNGAAAENWLSTNIWTIAFNVLTDIGIIATYLVIGYVIYGGYLYMFSAGEAAKVAAGKKTLTQAFIGLAIVMLASVIVNAIRIAILGANGSLAANCVTTQCVDANTAVTNAIQWVVGVSGVVAAIFLVIGGFSYMTSAGDPGKLQKAKNTIMYALIGLAVVAFAEIITATVSNIIRDANKSSFINQTTIAKELHEKTN